MNIHQTNPRVYLKKNLIKIQPIGIGIVVLVVVFVAGDNVFVVVVLVKGVETDKRQT